jgi:hypothetical protein
LPDRFINEYFSALAANDPSSLSLAADSQITANGELMPLAKTIWESADGTGAGLSFLCLETTKGQ